MIVTLSWNLLTFLEGCEDVVSFAKNYYEVHFKIDYKNANGSISYYYPDFFVKVDNKNIYIVETKGRGGLGRSSQD